MDLLYTVRGSVMAEQIPHRRGFWRALRCRLVFVIAGMLILFIGTVAAFLALFTRDDPTYVCRLYPGSTGFVDSALVRCRFARPRHLRAHHLRCASIGHRLVGGYFGRLLRW